MSSRGSTATPILGTWWRPSEQDVHRNGYRVAGHLTISDDDWKLTTVGSLLSDAADDLPMDAAAKYPTQAIFGKTQDAQAISLVDIAGRTNQNMVFSMNSDLSGVSYETWIFDTYITGDIHVEMTEVASKVIISIEGLSLWANGVRDNPHSDEPVLDISDEKITYTQPDPWEAVVSHRHVHVRLRRAWSSSHHPVSGFRATKDGVFILDGDIPLDHIRDKWVAPLQRLVAFWTLGPVKISKVTAYIDVKVNGRTESLPLDVRFRYHRREPEHGPPKTLGVHWLASLDQLIYDGTPCETLISRWLELDQYYDVTTGYLQESADKSLPLDRKLLAAFMGLEAFHATKVSHGQLPDRGFNSRQKVVDLTDVTDSTQRRFMAVYPELPDLARDLRNTAAHGNLLWNSKFIYEWRAGIIWIRWTLRHLILNELGFTTTQIDSIFDECLRLSNEINHLDQQNPTPEEPVRPERERD